MACGLNQSASGGVAVEPDDRYAAPQSKERLVLILTRKDGEAITIGDEITVRVVMVDGTHVRIGIDAPRDIPVHREEVAQRIREEAGAFPRPFIRQ